MESTPVAVHILHAALSCLPSVTCCYSSTSGPDGAHVSCLRMDNYPGSVSCASLGSQICIPVLLLFGWLIARGFIWVLLKRVHDDKLVEVSLVVGSTFWWRCFAPSHMMPIDARMPAESSGLRVQVFLEASAKSLQSLMFAVNVNRSAFFPEVLDFLHVNYFYDVAALCATRSLST